MAVAAGSKVPWWFRARYKKSGGGGGGSAWHPSAVAFLVLDADTLAQANGSAVTNWPSTGSNPTIAAVQSTALNQPSFQLAAQNGRSLVHFDGVHSSMAVSNMTMSSTTAVSFLGLFNSIAANWPMFMVLIPVTSTGWSNYELRGYSNTSNWDIGDPQGNDLQSPMSYVGWHILAAVISSSGTVNLYTDGNLTSDASASGSYEIGIGSVSNLQVGSRADYSFPFSGSMAAVCIVSGDLANSDRQKIEGWMANKWGLTSLLPAGHPYKNSPP